MVTFWILIGLIGWLGMAAMAIVLMVTIEEKQKIENMYHEAMERYWIAKHASESANMFKKNKVRVLGRVQE